LIPSVKESHSFKQFLSIEDHFPELRDALKEDSTIANSSNSCTGKAQAFHGIGHEKFSSSIMKLEEIIEEGIQARMHASFDKRSGKENTDERLHEGDYPKAIKSSEKQKASIQALQSRYGAGESPSRYYIE
jgi:hypothetical protein